jgi:hypothetical protein
MKGNYITASNKTLENLRIETALVPIVTRGKTKIKTPAASINPSGETHFS